MLQILSLFVNKILQIGGFRRSEFPDKAYRELLTALSDMSKHDVVMISGALKRLKRCRGTLIVDTTDNPKYGLDKLAIKMKNLSNGAYQKGFKIVLFLYNTGEHIIPIGFSLLHKENRSQEQAVLRALSILRNKFKISPKVVVADGAFGTQRITKRLDDYGWGFVIKGKKNYSLDGRLIKYQIQRGYGSTVGRLKNRVKVKVVRRPKRVYMSNRVSQSDSKLLATYTLRWKIEEVFRFLKSCVGLNGCQQHSMQAQAVYVFGCLVIYSIFEAISTESLYKTAHSFFLGELRLDVPLISSVFKIC